MTDAIPYAIGDALMWLSLAGVVTFTVSYASFFNWRKTAAGRSLMYLSVALIMWAAQTSVARLNPNYFGREWVRIVVYLAIAYTVWRLVLTLWKSWRKTPFKIEPRKKEEL